MGLLFALFGLVFLGFALIALAIGASALWFLTHLGLGLAALAYAFLTGFRELVELMGRGVRGRRARYGGNVLVQTAAFAAILGVAAFLSMRHSVHRDWTEAQLHSLSPASLEVVRQIPDTGLEILAFFTSGSESEAKKALDLYPYASPRVRVRIVDPNAHPALSQRFDVRANGVILVCAGACEQASGSVRVTAASEQELTKAIRQAISARRKVYFAMGHGEGSIDDGELEGFSRAKSTIEGENMTVEALLLATVEDVPKDADALVLGGPDRAYLDRELEALDRYLRGGGALLVLYDPFRTLNLESKLREWGIEPGNDVIVDQQIQLFAGPQVGVQPIVTEYGAHPITKDMKEHPTLFNVARSLRAGGPEAVALASTGKASWAETDLERFTRQSQVALEASDTRGPLAVAVGRAFEPAAGGAEGGRLVVVGDSDFARNRYIAEFFNADFLLNAVNWLVGQEQFVTIDRKLPRASRAAITVEQFDTFKYLALFLLPEVLLLFGIFSWWRRRT